MSDDERLLQALGDALTEEGELLPTNEAEVARAEAQLDAGGEVTLPPRLKTLIESPEAVVDGPTDLGAYREARRRGLSPWITHGATAVLRAAAAAALLVMQSPPPRSGATPSAEATASTAGPTPSSPLSLSLSACDGCCGGEDCSNSKEDLARCASGRHCVPCDVGKPSLYRLRVGAITPGEGGEQVLRDFPQGKPELCVRAGVSDETCVPTRLERRTGDKWQQLPIVVSREQLGAKLSLRVRWKGVTGAKATAARWSQVVGVTPRALCRGYPVQLMSKDDTVFGSLSLFIDDAHYVELARSADPAQLRVQAARFTLQGLTLSLQETDRLEGGQFVLTTGPYNKKTAEALRWQLLEQKQPGTVSLGLDYVGAAQPLR